MDRMAYEAERFFRFIEMNREIRQRKERDRERDRERRKRDRGERDHWDYYDRNTARRY